MSDVAAQLLHLTVNFSRSLGVSSLDVGLGTLSDAARQDFLYTTHQVKVIGLARDREHTLREREGGEGRG